MNRKTLDSGRELVNKINSLNDILEKDNFIVSETGLPLFPTKRFSNAVEKEITRVRKNIVELIKAELVLLNQEFEKL
ncbi:MAG: hypothetical protein U9O94_04160 [Nanoarchaeota archaeon]|nr:hypothetical protein [Nanoarchaeota archaeon]